jgi:hypothetical protein
MDIHDALEKDIRTLVARIAEGELQDYCQYGSIHACLYCSWTAYELNQQAHTYAQYYELLKTEVKHDPDCPIVLARNILPLLVP